MILGDFLRALAQLPDPRFLRVLVLGVALSAALLLGIGFATVAGIDLFLPDTLTLPVFGQVHGLHFALSFATVLLIAGLSVFLMMPVASAFSGLFLDQIAQAVEDRYYPGLPPVPVLGWGELLADAAGFFGLLILANLIALAIYPFAGPAAPFVFWAVNGFLLGREYFQLAAMRRLGREGARALRRRHAAEIWIAGTLMAVPLSLPVVNLIVPVLGAATFTHLFHRLAAGPSGGTYPDRAR